MYEPRNIPPIPSGRFFLRILSHGFIALVLVSVSLIMGITGYMTTEKMNMLDAFLNASMLLGGMGPVKTEGLSAEGKLFAGIYALYAGLVFIAVMSIMLAPVVHRIMHRLHWESVAEKE
ncbi:MAG: hypothetical protein HGA81_06445 [Chlorobium limicola]|jgi:hypothetical protein|uniref:Potassium channel domain-containing protein n=2 Tax=Chlorobium limicola TaxID=1092 RepID=B3ECD0_CHLL2|nr:hypothetical protein [Chlorobium limicola]ACD90205.1 conserved hypothetical protein [Chlorobium limicola DSM 245]NTV08228.1 hypothetical protein [Chlorobium limicola]NTV19972.1 hypothetical protein [Chlorobium limicola]